MKKISQKDFNSLVDLYKSNLLKKAEIETKKMINIYSNELILFNLLGAILIKKRDLDGAKKCFLSALKINPNYAEAYNNLGNVFREQKKYEKALTSFNKALKLKPKFAEAYNNLGIIYKEQEDFKKAILQYKKSISINPRIPDSYNNIGNIFKDEGNFKEAVKYFNKALTINPKFAEAHNNLGLTLQKQGKYKEASKSFNTAILLNPIFYEPKYNLGYMQLAKENFIEGWKNHENRKAKNILTKKLLLDSKKMWNGKKFNGKLLVLGEQGLGDQVLFSSILNDLLSIQKNITVTIEDRLLSLFQRSFKKIIFISDKVKINLNNFDKYIFLGSLGKFFRRTIQEFPKNQKPFLIPNKKNVDKINKLLNYTTKKKIGISWETSSINNRRGRSIRLKKFEKILKLKKYKFIDLQYGNTLKERLEVKKDLGINILHFDRLDYKNNIEDLAALISKCDLVITIPNFTTQIAAAIGVPVFVLLPFNSDWRWFLKRSNSPWYPNIKLIRQKRLWDWENAINEVYKNLA